MPLWMRTHRRADDDYQEQQHDAVLVSHRLGGVISE